MLEHCQFIAVVDVVNQVSHIVEPSAAMSDVAECYDPAFLLPLFTHLLAPGKLFFVYHFCVKKWRILICIRTYFYPAVVCKFIGGGFLISNLSSLAQP